MAKSLQTEIQTFLNFVIQEAKRRFQPEKIILFGSRARGDAHAFSDIDIAFDFDHRNPDKLKAWNQFCVDLDYDAPILLNFDLIDMNNTSKSLKTNILKHGKIIYKK